MLRQVSCCRMELAGGVGRRIRRQGDIAYPGMRYYSGVLGRGYDKQSVRSHGSSVRG